MMNHGVILVGTGGTARSRTIRLNLMEMPQVTNTKQIVQEGEFLCTRL